MISAKNRRIDKLLLVGLLSLHVSVQAQKVRVAVAANAQFVMGKLQTEFERKTRITLEPVINSSGKLTTQIQQGAPFDVFLSADMQYPDALYASGQASTKPRIYAYGLLVLWTRTNTGSSTGLSALSKPQIRKIALANPKTAPYGAAAVELLTSQGLLTKIQEKIVYGESIAQVNQYLLSGAVDAGFTAKSVVLEPALRGKGRWIEVEGATPIAQGVVLLKNAGDGARQFYDFLFSPSARAIFQQYGYRLPTPSARP
jgi:molybdate transport system substrate-binding protein